MGKAAFVRIENHTPEVFEVRYGDFSCMRQGGDEGSDFGPISGPVEPRGRLPAGGEWQRIEKETGAFSACSYQDGFFGMTVRGAGERPLAYLKFQASNAGYRVIEQQTQAYPPSAQAVRVDITPREGGNHYEIRAAITPKSFSRPLRLRLAGFYANARGLACLAPSSDRDADGEYWLTAWGGWGRDVQYGTAPIGVIEAADRFDPDAGVTLAFPSSDPRRSTLFVTERVKSRSGLAHVVLDGRRDRAARFCIEVSERGLLLRLASGGGVLTISGARTCYEARRLDHNALDQVAPNVQYFALPAWDARYLCRNEPLLIGARLDGRPHYLGLGSDGLPTVTLDPCVWAFRSDPFSIDVAEGGVLAQGERYLAEWPQRTPFDPTRPFTLTSNLDEALRLLPIRFGANSFGLWHATTLARLAVRRATPGYSMWLASAAPNAVPGAEERFMVEAGSTAGSGAPRYWIRHRPSAKVLALRDDRSEAPGSVILEERAVASAQLWALERGMLCAHRNGAPLVVSASGGTKGRKLTVDASAESSPMRLTPRALCTVDGESAASVDTDGVSIVTKRNDPAEVDQTWDVVPYVPSPRCHQNLFEAALSREQPFALLCARGQHALGADPATRAARVTPLTRSDGRSGPVLATQLWTYHDGVLASHADPTLILSASDGGSVVVVPFDERALGTRRWGLSADGFIVLRNGSEEVLSCDEKGAVSLLRRYDARVAHDDYQRWTVFPG